MGDPGGHEKKFWDLRGPREGALWSQGSPDGSQGAPGQSPGGPMGCHVGPQDPSGGHLAPPGGGLGRQSEPFLDYWGNVKSLKNHSCLLLFRDMGGPGGHKRELWDLCGPGDGLLWSQGSPEGSLEGTWGSFRSPWEGHWESLGGIWE